MAVAKVENGEIKKVVVVKKGRGYRNPVAIARGGPPKDLGNYDFSTTTFSKGDLYNSNIIKKTCGQKKYTRYWRCTNVRETLGGRFERCGHTEVGLYPPEKCPGEATADSNLTEERTPEAVRAWKKTHMDTCHYLFESTHFLPRPSTKDFDNENEIVTADNNLTHVSMSFKSRVCSGTKINFKLLNDPYRWPYEKWELYDAEIIPFVENGEIVSFEVVHGGAMYLSTEVGIMGSGAGVDVIPMFGEDGNLLSNTEKDLPSYLFDDPDLKITLQTKFHILLGQVRGFRKGHGHGTVLNLIQVIKLR